VRNYETYAGQITADIHRGDANLVAWNADAWTDLCKRSISDAPFYRPEWIAAYLNAFEPDADVLLAMAQSDGRLQALLPLIERQTVFCGFPVRMLRGAGNEHSCRFDLVRVAGRRGDLAVRAIWENLRAYGGWDLIELPYVPENGAAERLLKEARKDGFLTGKYESYRSPYVPLPDSGGEVALAAHFRRNLQRRLRKAHEKWHVSLKHLDRADPATLDQFFELEAGGWKGKKRTAITCSESTRRFYGDVALAGAEGGYFSLYLLQFGETVVAGHFGLSLEGRYYSPKVAYNEAFAEYGPGHLIVDAILKDVQARGFHEFDFLGPEMDWKGEWTREGRTHSFCYIFRRGPFGQTLHAAKLKLLPALRRFAPLRRIVRAVS
jgi:CelD/BcsL family acetyltransferase involved in cellulose biosynthesis